jgi:hypothetical protein
MTPAPIHQPNGMITQVAFGRGPGFRAGIDRAIAKGWLTRHESGTYVKFTETGAALFA